MKYLARALLKNRRPEWLADAGSRTLLIAVFCGLQALLIAAVADGVLGYGGTQLLTVWAFSTLLSVAAIAVTVSFIAAFGLSDPVARMPGLPNSGAPT